MFENESISIECPKCKRKIAVKVANVRPGTKLKCSCGQEIVLKGDNLKTKLKPIEDELNKIAKAFK